MEFLWTVRDLFEDEPWHTGVAVANIIFVLGLLIF
jgi:hypothetical protein